MNTEIGKQRVIVKYKNRKLYDKASSGYVTLNELTSLIKSGESLKVVDNHTKLDITKKVYSTILANEVLSNENLSVNDINNFIRNSSLSV